MLSLRLKYGVSNKLLKCRRLFATAAVSNPDEYTDTPQYPLILDLSLEKVQERKRQAYHDEVRAVKTVEEKQIKLNMPRYYGFKCRMFFENYVPYDNLELVQHITRTHLIRDSFPDYYNNIDVDGALGMVKSDIEEAIFLELEGYRKNYEINKTSLSENQIEDIVSSAVSLQVNRTLLNNLCKDLPHLANTLTDIDPRIESSWFTGGMIAPLGVQKWRKGKPWLKDEAKEPVDRAIQYIGMPNLTVRSEVPLCPIIPYSEAQNPSFDVPFFKYDPAVVGIRTEHRRLVNTPGFWPGDAHQFGLISYHRRGHLLERKCHDQQDYDETLQRQGILSSFGWLNAQANFLGFTTYNDVTYPLVTQCIVTNGQFWSFYVYQLNTLLVHGKNTEENPKKNVCWATKEFKLFEEIKEGKIIGFNEDVLKMLCKFYANVPQERTGVELRPYLSSEEKIIADYEDNDKREWLEREYKFITSNRPRHALPYEVYNWEKIYKIDHKMRPFEARRRPFELFINPWARKYDERLPRYIPRKLRPDLPRYKGRYAKEYFP